MEKRKFSGYLMAVYAVLITMATLGFGFMTLSLYVPPLLTELNVSLTAISVMYTVLSAASMVASFVSGKITEKIGLKKLVILGCLSLLVGYVVMYFTTNLVMLYIAAALIGISSSWAGVICIGRITPNWFIEKRGTMLGIVMAASGVGGFIGAPIISSLMASAGWRTASLVTFGILVVLTVPAMLLIKEKPADLNQVPLGYDENAQKATGGNNVVAEGPTFAQARKSPSFWLYFLFAIAISMCVSFNGHISNAFSVKGFSVVFLGTIVSIQSISNSAGNIVLGVVNDKFGTKAGLAWCFVCGLLSMVVMLFAQSNALAITFAVLFGLGQSMKGTLITLVTARSFGPKAFGQMLGIANSISAFMSMIAGIVIAALYDSAGSYTPAIIVIIAALVIGYIATMASFKSYDKLAEKVAAEKVAA